MFFGNIRTAKPSILLKSYTPIVFSIRRFTRRIFLENEHIFRFCLKNNIYEICYSFFQIRLKFPYFGGIIVL